MRGGLRSLLGFACEIVQLVRKTYVRQGKSEFERPMTVATIMVGSGLVSTRLLLCLFPCASSRDGILDCVGSLDF